MQDLDRDSLPLWVECAEQGGIAAPPDGGDDLVARAERFLHALDEIAGHAGNRRRGAIKRKGYGLVMRENDRLSKRVSALPMPAKRTAATPLSLTHSDCACCTAFAVTRLSTLPSLARPSMNAASGTGPINGGGPTTGTASMHTRETGTVNRATTMPESALKAGAV